MYSRIRTGFSAAAILCIAAVILCGTAAADVSYSSSSSASGRGSYEETIIFNNAGSYGFGPAFAARADEAFVSSILNWNTDSSSPALSSLMGGNSGYGASGSIFRPTAGPSAPYYLDEFRASPGGEHGWMWWNSATSGSSTSFSTSISISEIS